MRLLMLLLSYFTIHALENPVEINQDKAKLKNKLI